jgi:F-type H+-transporting ATPase subunit b
MLIDWFTVLAQIVNFIILVFLLKRFLYGPITKAMDEREMGIAFRLKEADEKVSEAEHQAQIYRQLNEELDRQREQMLQQARQDSEATRKELTQKVRTEVSEARQRWFEALNQEKNSFIQDLRKLASVKIFAMARLVFKSLSNADLEGQIIETFISRLEGLDQDNLEKLAASLQGAADGILIQSAFELPAEYRQRLVDTVKRKVGVQFPLQFEVVPELLGGIAIKGYSYETAWNMDSYWKDLESGLEQALEQELAGKLLKTVDAGGGI